MIHQHVIISFIEDLKSKNIYHQVYDKPMIILRTENF